MLVGSEYNSGDERMYKPINYKQSFQNPADKFSRIFQYMGYNEEAVLTSKCQYFAVDTETSLISEGVDDQQVVAWSLVPKQMPYSKYGICSHTFTDNNTAITGLFDTLAYFGCDNSEIYAYFHYFDYDGFFILNWLVKSQEYQQLRSMKLTAKNVQEHEKEYTILYNNNLLEVRVAYKNKCLVFRNSFKLWSASIDEISEELVRINEKDIKRGEKPSFPLIRKKTDCKYDYEAIRKFGEKIPDEEVIYMLNDVHVSCAVLQMFQKFGGLGISCSGMAYKVAQKSFQKGILTVEVVKYILLNRIDDIADNRETRQYIKLVVRGAKTYVFAKNYYTINYSELTDKSEEYITEFDTIYIGNNGTLRPLKDIDMLMEDPALNLKWKIKKALEGVATEFKANKSISDNIVFNHYRALNTDLLINQIVDFLALRDLKALKIMGVNRVKSYDYYYQSVFKPLTFQEDEELREAYRGGLSTAVEIYSNTMQHNVVGIDINSSYPYQMSERELPYGEAKIYIEPSSEEFQRIKKEYKTYIIKFQASYKLQRPYNPMVSQKNMFGTAKFNYSDMMYRQIRDDEYLCMTNAEFELFCKTHGVNENEIIIEKIWAFQSFKGIFKPFVRRMYKIKAQYKGTSMYEPVKQMLNSVYGRYGMNRYKYINYETAVNFNDKNIMYYTKEEKTDIDYNIARGSYLPVAIFITSYARVQLVETANAINEAGGRVFYYDTDSLHFTAENIRLLEGQLLVNNKDVARTDKIALGAWKIEIYKKITENNEVVGADEGLYVASKRYMETDNDTGIKNIKYAGVPYRYREDMTYNDIRIGVEVEVNKKIKTETGIILKPMNKMIDLKRNIYQTSNGVVMSEDYYNIGDKIKDMYGDNAEITGIIHKTKYVSKIMLV